VTRDLSDWKQKINSHRATGEEEEGSGTRLYVRGKRDSGGEVDAKDERKQREEQPKQIAAITTSSRIFIRRIYSKPTNIKINHRTTLEENEAKPSQAKDNKKYGYNKI